VYLLPGIDPIAKALVDRFGMTPLPVEATFFAQTYRSAASTGDVPADTAPAMGVREERPGRSELESSIHGSIPTARCYLCKST
jgi:hypothetical protein